ncbi:hypothetical protein H696_01430 [Fonticula alba]|uniref:ARID domain-containing protein n=1 Tax=Fonticula alba TaxID=691883 RepID=A0A058ZDM1_FONAL|nr:hypothetical protein H696_01430 [Fonticula alba]KCV72023.1 hypothetical protein H696_01430 [Fonticula alba]|eukprot:XP_009493601.1 hypothetical protein H696_01430 [Fonticula alba]
MSLESSVPLPESTSSEAYSPSPLSTPRPHRLGRSEPISPPAAVPAAGSPADQAARLSPARTPAMTQPSPEPPATDPRHDLAALSDSSGSSSSNSSSSGGGNNSGPSSGAASGSAPKRNRMARELESLIAFNLVLDCFPAAGSRARTRRSPSVHPGGPRSGSPTTSLPGAPGSGSGASPGGGAPVADPGRSPPVSPSPRGGGPASPVTSTPAGRPGPGGRTPSPLAATPAGGPGSRRASLDLSAGGEAVHGLGLPAVHAGAAGAVLLTIPGAMPRRMSDPGLHGGGGGGGGGGLLAGSDGATPPGDAPASRVSPSKLLLTVPATMMSSAAGDCSAAAGDTKPPGCGPGLGGFDADFAPGELAHVPTPWLAGQPATPAATGSAKGPAGTDADSDAEGLAASIDPGPALRGGVHLAETLDRAGLSGSAYLTPQLLAHARHHQISRSLIARPSQVGIERLPVFVEGGAGVAFCGSGAFSSWWPLAMVSKLASVDPAREPYLTFRRNPAFLACLGTRAAVSFIRHGRVPAGFAWWPRGREAEHKPPIDGPTSTGSVTGRPVRAAAMAAAAAVASGATPPVAGLSPAAANADLLGQALLSGGARQVAVIKQEPLASGPVAAGADDDAPGPGATTEREDDDPPGNGDPAGGSSGPAPEPGDRTRRSRRMPTRSPGPDATRSPSPQPVRRSSRRPPTPPVYFPSASLADAPGDGPMADPPGPAARGMDPTEEDNASPSGGGFLSDTGTRKRRRRIKSPDVLDDDFDADPAAGGPSAGQDEPGARGSGPGMPAPGPGSGPHSSMPPYPPPGTPAGGMGFRSVSPSPALFASSGTATPTDPGLEGAGSGAGDVAVLATAGDVARHLLYLPSDREFIRGPTVSPGAVAFYDRLRRVWDGLDYAFSDSDLDLDSGSESEAEGGGAGAPSPGQALLCEETGALRLPSGAVLGPAAQLLTPAGLLQARAEHLAELRRLQVDHTSALHGQPPDPGSPPSPCASSSATVAGSSASSASSASSSQVSDPPTDFHSSDFDSAYESDAEDLPLPGEQLAPSVAALRRRPRDVTRAGASPAPAAAAASTPASAGSASPLLRSSRQRQSAVAAAGASSATPGGSAGDPDQKLFADVSARVLRLEADNPDALNLRWWRSALRTACATRTPLLTVLGVPRLTRPPVVGNAQVDLRQLYRAVRRRGGVQAVTETSLWRDVYYAIELPNYTTNFAYHLRDVYRRYLLPYEARLRLRRRSHTDPEAWHPHVLDQSLVLPVPEAVLGGRSGGPAAGGSARRGVGTTEPAAHLGSLVLGWPKRLRRHLHCGGAFSATSVRQLGPLLAGTFVGSSAAAFPAVTTAAHSALVAASAVGHGPGGAAGGAPGSGPSSGGGGASPAATTAATAAAAAAAGQVPLIAPVLVVLTVLFSIHANPQILAAGAIGPPSPQLSRSPTDSAAAAALIASVSGAVVALSGDRVAYRPNDRVVVLSPRDRVEYSARILKLDFEGKSSGGGPGTPGASSGPGGGSGSGSGSGSSPATGGGAGTGPASRRGGATGPAGASSTAGPDAGPAIPRRYFVHYNGWNSSYDEWVPSDHVLRPLGPMAASAGNPSSGAGGGGSASRKRPGASPAAASPSTPSGPARPGAGRSLLADSVAMPPTSPSAPPARHNNANASPMTSSPLISVVATAATVAASQSDPGSDQPSASSEAEDATSDDDTTEAQQTRARRSARRQLKRRSVLSDGSDTMEGGGSPPAAGPAAAKRPRLVAAPATSDHDEDASDGGEVPTTGPDVASPAPAAGGDLPFELKLSPDMRATATAAAAADADADADVSLEDDATDKAGLVEVKPDPDRRAFARAASPPSAGGGIGHGTGGGPSPTRGPVARSAAPPGARPVVASKPGPDGAVADDTMADADCEGASEDGDDEEEEEEDEDVAAATTTTEARPAMGPVPATRPSTPPPPPPPATIPARGPTRPKREDVPAAMSGPSHPASPRRMPSASAAPHLSPQIKDHSPTRATTAAAGSSASCNDVRFSGPVVESDPSDESFPASPTSSPGSSAASTPVNGAHLRPQRGATSATASPAGALHSPAPAVDRRSSIVIKMESPNPLPYHRADPLLAPARALDPGPDLEDDSAAGGLVNVSSERRGTERAGEWEDSPPETPAAPLALTRPRRAVQRSPNYTFDLDPADLLQGDEPDRVAATAPSSRSESSGSLSVGSGEGGAAAAATATATVDLADPGSGSATPAASGRAGAPGPAADDASDAGPPGSGRPIAARSRIASRNHSRSRSASPHPDRLLRRANDSGPGGDSDAGAEDDLVTITPAKQPGARGGDSGTTPGSAAAAVAVARLSRSGGGPGGGGGRLRSRSASPVNARRRASSRAAATGHHLSLGFESESGNESDHYSSDTGAGTTPRTPGPPSDELDPLGSTTASGSGSSSSSSSNTSAATSRGASVSSSAGVSASASLASLTDADSPAPPSGDEAVTPAGGGSRRGGAHASGAGSLSAARAAGSGLGGRTPHSPLAHGGAADDSPVAQRPPHPPSATRSTKRAHATAGSPSSPAVQSSSGAEAADGAAGRRGGAKRRRMVILHSVSVPESLAQALRDRASEHTVDINALLPGLARETSPAERIRMMEARLTELRQKYQDLRMTLIENTASLAGGRHAAMAVSAFPEDDDDEGHDSS